MNMKKILASAVLLLALMPAICLPAQSRGINKTKLTALLREYKTHENVEVVNLGSMAMSLLRGAAKVSADSKEDRDALKLLDGLKRITIVSYEDAAPDIQKKLSMSIDQLLAGQEPLMEVKSDGETVHFFGVLSPDGKTVDDVVIHVPDSGSLICLFGSVQASQLETVIANGQKK